MKIWPLDPAIFAALAAVGAVFAPNAHAEAPAAPSHNSAPHAAKAEPSTPHDAPATSHSESVKAESLPVVAPPAVHPEPVVPAAPRFANMDLLRWPNDKFHEAYVKLVSNLSTSHGQEQSAILLDAAELFLGQMLLYEAETVLTGVDARKQQYTMRHRALSDAVKLLGGAPLPEPATSPLTHEARPDRAFWQTLQAIATGDAALLNESFARGFSAIAHQPKPVMRAVLPVFTETAIELKQIQIAEIAVRLLNEVPDLAKAPAGDFLRGRHAEMLGNNKSALDAYFDASKGYDRYAARSRQALADMALKENSEGALLAARDVLENGAGSWRGDDFEMVILQRQAEVYARLKDARGGLLTFGKILARFPGTATAAEALVQARALLRDAYGDGAAGKLSLAHWVDLHLRIMPWFSRFPEFADYTETLADKALALGGTDLAAKEYSRTLNLLQETAALHGLELAPLRVAKVQLKLARAHFKAGLLDEALELISKIDRPKNQAFRNEYDALQAQILAAGGKADLLMLTNLTAPDARHLRDLGRVLVQKQDWPRTVALYSRLWKEFPQDFNAEDASYMLIAAFRAGDKTSEAAVVAAFPGLTQSRAWIDLAEGLIETPTQLLPLRLEAASDRLDSVDRTLQKIKDSGF